MGSGPTYEQFIQKMAQSQSINQLLLRAVEYHDKEKLTEAAAVYEEILQRDPNHADSLHLLAIIEHQLGNIEKAFELLSAAVQNSPENPIYLSNLGSLLAQKSEYDSALLCLEKAIDLKPNFAEPHYSIGLVLGKLGKADQAISYLEKAIDLKPAFPEALNALVMQLQKLCSWNRLRHVGDELDELTRKRLSKGEVAAEDPLTNLRRHGDPSYNLVVAKSWSEMLERYTSHLRVQLPVTSGRRGKSKIRVGYLSNNFSNHPVAHQIFGLFSLHNRQDFEISCYTYGKTHETGCLKEIQKGCDHFVDLSSTADYEAAKTIHDDRIDILVDLVGHTDDNRMAICALRPVPIQVSYLGFLGTTGASFFDYLITDSIVTPRDHAPYYTENLVYLPDSYQVNTPLTISQKKWGRSDFGLPEDAFIFCSFNNPYKIEQLLFDRWIEILGCVPNAVLWLLKDNKTAERNLRSYAERRGVHRERLVFSPRLPLAEHLERLGLADLALDTLTYNGGATTSNALWAGVPVITVLGSHFVSRMSASSLSSVGLSDLITKTLSEYKELAIRLAHNPDELATIKSNLRDNLLTKPLFHTSLFCKNLENAYRQMWEIFKGGQKTRPIEVIAT